MAMNPIKAYRLSESLTQRELSVNCQVTRQVIINLESGLMNSLPATVGWQARTTNLEYQLWRVQERKQNKEPFSKANVSDGWLPFRLSVTSSFRGFCRLLVFQPSVLTLFESHHQNRIVLADALSDVGLNLEVLARIGVLGPHDLRTYQAPEDSRIRVRT